MSVVFVLAQLDCGILNMHNLLTYVVNGFEDFAVGRKEIDKLLFWT